MAEQRLALPSGVELAVRRSRVGGGTGAVPWKGGVILAGRVCSWSGRPREDLTESDADGSPPAAGASFDSLFRGRRVLELGAGAAALPSMTLGRLAENGLPASGVDVTASDGVECNVRANGLDGLVKVRHVNWNDYLDDGSAEDDRHKADTILFADCIYNDDCAIALCRAIERLLSPGGCALGVLPLFRAGIDVFRKLMDGAGFEAVNVPLVSTRGGGGGEDAPCTSLSGPVGALGEMGHGLFVHRCCGASISLVAKHDDSNSNTEGVAFYSLLLPAGDFSSLPQRPGIPAMPLHTIRSLCCAAFHEHILDFITHLACLWAWAKPASGGGTPGSLEGLSPVCTCPDVTPPAATCPPKQVGGAPNADLMAADIYGTLANLFEEVRTTSSQGSFEPGILSWCSLVLNFSGSYEIICQVLPHCYVTAPLNDQTFQWIEQQRKPQEQVHNQQYARTARTDVATASLFVG
ncbi:hypothetical protein THAOC_35469 [Thalassiosira oceanica]|uniref:Methyltransferase domain-containing protein n=1 Tax=Thalassiosira oceanica TaxID=159749 RepID=K0RA68_THAOC|nr:hypothetical protein THAOC_35469 [Thalassiosira oceanica]|eukprot:EJK45896.1 hypothetical protein THAOC_35469 [Thalassiosira oceanica]